MGERLLNFLHLGEEMMGFGVRWSYCLRTAVQECVCVEGTIWWESIYALERVGQIMKSQFS